MRQVRRVFPEAIYNRKCIVYRYRCGPQRKSLTVVRDIYYDLCTVSFRSHTTSIRMLTYRFTKAHVRPVVPPLLEPVRTAWLLGARLQSPLELARILAGGELIDGLESVGVLALGPGGRPDGVLELG